MLQILRNKAQSIVIQAIVVIIALVFIFWGVGSNLDGSRESAITVNDEEISFQDFQMAYDRAHQNLAAQFGGTLPKGLAESLGVKEQVISQLVQGALLRQGAADMGIVVSGEEIQETVKSMPQFQENGLFNIERYESLLAANGLTPVKFESNLRFDMLAEKTIREISKFAALTSEYEVQQLYRQENEKVAVDYVRITPDQFTDSVKVDEEELATWFAEVRDNYRSKPMMKLRYFDFSFSEVGKKINIDNARVEEYYSNNIGQFTTPEKRHARHILLTANAQDNEELHQEKSQRAKEIAELAAVSDDFAELARQYSEGPSGPQGGDLGFFSQEQMVPEFGDAVFAMQPGEVSEVVKTAFGYHIIKLEEIQPAVTKTLDDARPEIIATLQNKEAQSMAFQMANGAYEGIIGAGSIQAYAENNPTQSLKESDFFAESAPPADVTLDAQALAKAFTLKKGELSSLIKTDNGYAIVFADDIKEPETPTLEAVRDRATENFVAEKAAEMAGQAAADFTVKLTSEASFEEVAKEMGISILNSGLLQRRAQEQENSNFPVALTQQAFKLTKVEPYSEEPELVGSAYYIMSLKERQSPEVSGEEDLEPYRQALLRSKQQELLTAFIDNLEKDAVVSVNKNI
ncbi:peptidylprolyl isomerase [Desulfosediminicola sp.]|uniref:peptidylprolyl isomerase n=1 Tax=Desulfosediminicola sp. TaxID=2886825 RepID=UPI003AF315CF